MIPPRVERLLAQPTLAVAIRTRCNGHGHEKVVEILQEQRADVNFQGGFFGGTPQAVSL